MSKITNDNYYNGFVNYRYSTSIYDCYYEDNNGDTYDNYATSLSTSEMKTASSYEDWDFENVWAIDANSNNGYPYLRFTAPHPMSVEITASKTTLYVGDTLQLSAAVLPDNAPQMVIWSSSDESVLTVSDSGYVTAMKEGIAEITARSGAVTGKQSIAVLTQQTAGNIVSVDEIAEIVIDYTTDYDDVLAVLPYGVSVNLTNDSKASLPVKWILNEGTKYTFTGVIELGENSSITNTDNIRASCTVKVLDEPSEIVLVEAPELSVPFTTSLDGVKALLPETLTVTLQNGKEYQLYVIWDDNSTPYYRSTTAGTYKFNGELMLPENGTILNSNEFAASASVTVEEKPATERKMTAIVASEGINVPFNTSLSDVKELLPDSVYAVLDNIESVPLEVAWSVDSEPSYKSKVPSVYVFTGTITTDGEGLIKNPYNLKATIGVTVAENEKGGRNIYLSDTAGMIGSTADVTVSFDANSTMTSGSFVIDYDASYLTPIAYKVEDAIDNASVMVNLNYTDPSDGNKKIKVSFVGVDELNSGGDAITITFKISDDCDSDLKIPVTAKSVIIYDADENPIAFEVLSGSITAADILLGDTNGDGEVNILDAFRVARFDAKLITFTEKQKKAADVDKNDTIDIFDTMKIQRFDIGLTDTLE